MIKFHCKNCGQKIRVPQIHAGKKGKCPKCKNMVVIPKAEGASLPASQSDSAKSEISSKYSDFDLTFLDVPQEDKAPIQPTSQYGVSDKVFGGVQESEERPRTDETEPIGKRKLPWLIDIFLYPISTPGLTMLGIVIGLPLLMKVVTKFMELIASAFPPFLVFAVLFLCISIIVNITVAVYLYWYLALCIRDSAEGNLRAPDVLVNSPSLGDMLWQLIKLFSCFMIFFLLIYFYISRVEGVGIGFWRSLYHAIFLIPIELSDAVQGDIIFWLLLFCVVFLFPMTLLAVVMFDSFCAFNPILIIGSIFSTFFQYFALVLLFCGICVPIAIIKRIVTERMILPGFQILPYITKLISIYLLMVGAHLLGRFYWRYQEKLNWEV